MRIETSSQNSIIRLLILILILAQLISPAFANQKLPSIGPCQNNIIGEASINCTSGDLPDLDDNRLDTFDSNQTAKEGQLDITSSG